MSTSPRSSTPSPPRPPGSGDADVAELDLRGEVCPYTFVRARLALESMPLGARLTIVIDHAPALRNLPRSLADWGQEVALASAPDAPSPWRLAVVKRAP
jgi:tRNA 2-thiouridine synthesizing protein A